MLLNKILPPNCVSANLVATSKRGAFESLSRAAAGELGVPAADILAAIRQREDEGTTGFGGGVGIPHGRLANIGQVSGYLARLSAPIDYDAIDDEPVDLLFLLLAPEQATAAHLKALAQVSRLFRDAELRAALRRATSADALYALANGARVEAA